MSIFKEYNFLAANTSNIATNQLPLNGTDIILNGVLAKPDGSSVNFIDIFGFVPRITVTCANDISARNIIIEGKQNGVSIVDTFPAPNGNTVTSNLCFDEIAQEPDYKNGKGRLISYDSMSELNKIREKNKILFGKKFNNMKCESNYYYDISKTGIGYHGDSERRKVVAVRIGVNLPIYYQWYLDGKKVGNRIKVELNGGDMYVMSEKAVGTDWKEKNIYTLRHATGCKKYID